MSVLRRITQETFDEVVQENIEEFDMTKEEAVQDATQQFFKQGIDLSNIDITTGEGRKELLEIFQSLLQTTIPSPDTPTTISQLQQITEAVQKQNPHYRRNITLIYHQGGLNAIHAHLDAREDVTILAIVIQLISELSLSNVEIRDFFEPGGSTKINGIITKLLSSSVNATNTPAEFTLLESSINLSRIVAKSEKNKTALIHAGIGNSIVQILQFYSTPTLNPTAITLLEKTTSLLRELCIHTDTRTEMSSAFDNGKFFIKQNQLIPIFIAIIRQYEQYPQLASNTLLAMKSMTTTNEAVQIISLHGIIELLSNVLSSYTKLILQLVSGESPIVIENLKNENIDADNRVISAEEAEEAEEDGADRTDLPLSGKKKTSPLLLLRSVVALIRNIIADDKKKEQFVTYGALESLVVLFLHSQQISSVTSATSSTESSSTTNKLSANLSNEWNITNDYFLIEHMFGCFAQFTLRSPKNSLYMMSENYSIFLPLMITYMKKYPQQDSLHRQICLMLHNIINRCPQFKTIFLDYHLEEILRNVSGVLPTVKDEAYVLLRDLGINIQYMKLDEQTGKLVPVYETFGNQSNRNFKAIYDEAENFQDRMVEEAHAPFGEKDIVIEVKRSGREKEDHDDHDDHDEADHDHSHSHHHEHSENCAHGEDHHSPHDNAQNHDDHHEHNHEHHH